MKQLLIGILCIFFFIRGFSQKKVSVDDFCFDKDSYFITFFAENLDNTDTLQYALKGDRYKIRQLGIGKNGIYTAVMLRPNYFCGTEVVKVYINREEYAYRFLSCNKCKVRNSFID